MSSTIAVEALRVGMYIHLDGGWLSHPFALSSFRIACAEQLATLRSLGLKQVRWVPEKSEIGGPPAAGPVHGAADTAGAAGSRAAPPAPEPAPPPTEAEVEAARRREALSAQRAAMQRCERQYGEAAQAWRAASDAVLARPEDAQRSTVALTRAMLEKMLVDGDIGVCLMGACGAERAAAHALNVAVISLLIGRSLGLPAGDMLDLGVGALLHDVGKLELPNRLRHADESFSAAEQNAYRDHVAKGVAHGRRMALSPGALSVLAQHHEHVDGSGFPQRLGAEGLSLPGRPKGEHQSAQHEGSPMSAAARIVAIVNRYDNLCNPPLRTPALTPHEAVATLFAQGRMRFDAALLGAFIRMMGVYPAGSLVQLTDERYAMVVGVNSSRPLKPRVLVHDARVPRSEALLLNLEHAPDLGIRRSLAAAKLPLPALEYLDPRPRVAYYFEPLAAVEQAEERPQADGIRRPPPEEHEQSGKAPFAHEPARGVRRVRVHAENAQAVAAALGLPPSALLSVELASAVPVKRRARLDLRLFSQELALLLRSGIPLLEALQTLREKDPRSPGSASLAALTEALRQGLPLSEALALAPGDFDELFIAIVSASERSGQLARALQDHAAYLAWSQALRSKLVAASIYPLLLLAAGGAVVMFLLLYVLPRFAVVFDEMGSTVPAASRWLLGFGVWAGAHPLLSLAAAAALPLAAAAAWRSPAARYALTRLVWRIPGLGGRWRVVALARLYRSLSVLLAAGVPVPAALRLAAPALAEPLRPALAEATAEVESGQRLSQALQTHGLATPVALRMVRVGENSGELATMLERAASFHDEEVARLTELVTRAVNPALMLVMGVVIGGIVVLMYLPIFALMEQVQ